MKTAAGSLKYKESRHVDYDMMEVALETGLHFDWLIIHLNSKVMVTLICMNIVKESLYDVGMNRDKRTSSP